MGGVAGTGSALVETFHRGRSEVEAIEERDSCRRRVRPAFGVVDPNRGIGGGARLCEPEVDAVALDPFVDEYIEVRGDTRVDE